MRILAARAASIAWMLDLNWGRRGRRRACLRPPMPSAPLRPRWLAAAGADEAAARGDEQGRERGEGGGGRHQGRREPSRRAVRERRSMPASVPSPSWIARPQRRPYPKIELHVHLEGTLRPATLLRLAGRNGVRLPADTVEGLREVLRFTDFPHFIEAWVTDLTGAAPLRRLPQRRRGLRGAGGVHGMRVPGGHLLAGRTGAARRRAGRRSSRATATAPRRRASGTASRCGSRRRSRATSRPRRVRKSRAGPSAIATGAWSAWDWVARRTVFPPEPFAPAFAIARAGGLGSVPHAGELAGPASVRGALEALHADRLRHGVRAVEDAGLLRELADRRICCDVTPIGNVRMGVVPSLAEHPLPRMVAAGVPCSISTDDPALMDTSLEQDCAAAESLGLRPRDFYFAAVAGALCDEPTRARLRAIGEAFDWDGWRRAPDAGAGVDSRGRRQRAGRERAGGCRRPIAGRGAAGGIVASPSVASGALAARAAAQAPARLVCASAILPTPRGRLAQLGERQLDKLEVVGSIPTSPTTPSSFVGAAHGHQSSRDRPRRLPSASRHGQRVHPGFRRWPRGHRRRYSRGGRAHPRGGRLHRPPARRRAPHPRHPSARRPHRRPAGAAQAHLRAGVDARRRRQARRPAVSPRGASRPASRVNADRPARHAVAAPGHAGHRQPSGGGWRRAAGGRGRTGRPHPRPHARSRRLPRATSAAASCSSATPPPT